MLANLNVLYVCYEMFTILLIFYTVTLYVFTGKVVENIERDVPSYRRNKIYLGNDLF
jgi:hypothetical protein